VKGEEKTSHNGESEPRKRERKGPRERGKKEGRSLRRGARSLEGTEKVRTAQVRIRGRSKWQTATSRKRSKMRNSRRKKHGRHAQLGKYPCLRRKEEEVIREPRIREKWEKKRELHGREGRGIAKVGKGRGGGKPGENVDRRKERNHRNRGRPSLKTGAYEN